MNILMWLSITCIIALISWISLAKRYENEFVENLLIIAAVLSSMGAFVLLLMSFSVRIPNGDAVVIESHILKTNYTTFVTFNDFKGEPQALIFKDAKRYCGNSITLTGQMMNNSWGKETFPKYTVHAE